MAKVNTADLYWDTLEPHRQAPYYRLLRFKLLHFIASKVKNPNESLSGDKGFQNPILKGIRHYKLMTKPEITLFYTQKDSNITLCMLGNHTDYSFKGSALKAEGRTAIRVNNASDRPAQMSPQWNNLKWADPLELLYHPDVPELSGAALLELLEEVNQEAESGEKFERKWSISLLDTNEQTFERYIQDLMKAQQMIIELRRNQLRHEHWSNNINNAQQFSIPKTDRVQDPKP